MDHKPSSYPLAEGKTNLGPAVGVYIHIPYCSHRCSYCDFFSMTDGVHAAFEPKILIETAQMRAWWEELGNSVRANTVFLGGGTPSKLGAAVRGRILQTARELWGEPSETTVETNPEDVSLEYLDSLVQSGVNRMSLGVQSFHDRFLQLLDRRVPSSVATNAITHICRHGDWNWSLDLIMGIPGQTKELLEQDIQTAVDYGPKHISVYALTLKSGHPLYKKLPGEELSSELFECASECLMRHGYRQYEISNFAIPGFECWHNLIYWSGGDFVGIGPSAASRYFDGVFYHRKQVADWGKYASQTDPREIPFERSTVEQTAIEAVFLEIRKDSGVRLEDFKHRYGLDLRASSRLDVLVSGGFLVSHEGWLRLTPKGRLLADSIAVELVR